MERERHSVSEHVGRAAPAPAPKHCGHPAPVPNPGAEAVVAELHTATHDSGQVRQNRRRTVWKGWAAWKGDIAPRAGLFQTPIATISININQLLVIFILSD